MEIVIFSIFCILLIVCVSINLSVVYALLMGLALFLIYGKVKGFSFKELFEMCAEGVKTSLNIMIAMLIIGALTALWRASGCISTMVCYASNLISPSIFLLLTFVLNALVSTLTGTAFGTAATMGVICANIGISMNLPIFWLGGAVLAGSFLGDRCSPVSTSLLLVSDITETNIYDNIKNIVKTAAIPFLVSCAIYLLAGFASNVEGSSIDVQSLFRNEFAIKVICILPAVAIIVLALFKMEVKTMMLISIAISAVIAIFVQGQSVPEILKTMVIGYQARTPEIADMISGGGIVSMINVSLVILIASCYTGIFRKTGILNFMEVMIKKIALKTNNFTAMLAVSIPISAISCNQTLAIMLSDQLMEDIEKDNEKRATYLSDSAVVVPALIPWSIASNVPLATVGAPLISILASVYLFALPIAGIIRYSIKKKKETAI